MATADAAAPTKSFLARTSEFYREVRAEMARVTWPDVAQVRQLSIGVIALSLFIGAIIALMDVILQQVLVVWIPRLFGAA
ncbi:MAG: preprotein translocase subunit SecE [Actinomycetota bacterium]|nr:preprotein translocase subunit SecE [Actinomycetota bacterium]